MTTPEKKLQNDVSRLLGDYRAWMNNVPGDTRAKDGIETRESIMQLFKDYIKKRDPYVIGKEFNISNTNTSYLIATDPVVKARVELRYEQYQRAKQYDSGDKL